MIDSSKIVLVITPFVFIILIHIFYRSVDNTINTQECRLRFECAKYILMQIRLINAGKILTNSFFVTDIKTNDHVGITKNHRLYNYYLHNKHTNGLFLFWSLVVFRTISASNDYR